MSGHLWSVFLDQALLVIDMQLIVFTGASLSSDTISKRVKLEIFQNISV